MACDAMIILHPLGFEDKIEFLFTEKKYMDFYRRATYSGVLVDAHCEA